jgi:hypothetical protein
MINLSTLTPEEKIAILETPDYAYFNVMHCKENDIYAGLTRLISTTAICFELGNYGFTERYCFSDPLLAIEELRNWHNRGFNDQRPIGWIACRSVSNAQLIESMKKHHSENYGMDTLDAYMTLFPSGIASYEAAPRIAKERNADLAKILHEIAYLQKIGLII